MKFRTEIQILPLEAPLDYSSRILSLGSCFASSIGQKLEESKFNIVINPVGVLFNPLSISSTLDRFASCRSIVGAELSQGRDQWFHFDFHGSLSAATEQEALSNINGAIARGYKALEECDTIIITLGTVWVYEHIESGRVVANCHKEPSRCFVRRRLTVADVVDCLGRHVERYAQKRFIFSVSPIRHLSDGLSENSLSKATLRVALSELEERYTNVLYFPAYEILLDDLRDYRFYGEDMLHPSPQAVEYIWSKFRESYIASQAAATMESVAAIIRAAAHHPFNSASSAHREFCRRQLDLIKEYPNIDFGKESDYFISQLQKKL